MVAQTKRNLRKRTKRNERVIQEGGWWPFKKNKKTGESSFGSFRRRHRTKKSSRQNRAILLKQMKKAKKEWKRRRKANNLPYSDIWWVRSKTRQKFENALRLHRRNEVNYNPQRIKLQNALNAIRINNKTLSEYLSSTDSIDHIRRKAIQLGVDRNIIRNILTRGFSNFHNILPNDPFTGEKYNEFKSERDIYAALIKWKLQSDINVGSCLNKLNSNERLPQIKDHKFDPLTKRLVQLRTYDQMKEKCEEDSKYEWIEESFTMDKEMILRKKIKAVPFYNIQDNTRDFDTEFLTLYQLKTEVDQGVYEEYDIDHEDYTKIEARVNTFPLPLYKDPSVYKEIRENLILKFREINPGDDWVRYDIRKYHLSSDRQVLFSRPQTDLRCLYVRTQ